MPLWAFDSGMDALPQPLLEHPGAHVSQTRAIIAQAETGATPCGYNNDTPEVVSVASESSWTVYLTAADTERARDISHAPAAMNYDEEYEGKDLLRATQMFAATRVVASAFHMC